MTFGRRRVWAVLAGAALVAVTSTSVGFANGQGTFSYEPMSGPVGTQVHVSGSNCSGPDPDVHFYFAELPQNGSPGVYLDDFPIQQDGTYSGVVTIPAKFEPTLDNLDGNPVTPGVYPIIGDCGVEFSNFPGESFRVDFTVTAGTPPVVPVDPNEPSAFSPPATPPVGDGPLDL